MSESFEVHLKNGGFLKGSAAGDGLWMLALQWPTGSSKRYTITSGRLFEALIALGMPVEDARRIASMNKED
jgi:hypothetical protein